MISGITRSNQTVSFGYDDIYQIVSEHGKYLTNSFGGSPSSVTVSNRFAYDAAGNRVSEFSTYPSLKDASYRHTVDNQLTGIYWDSSKVTLGGIIENAYSADWVKVKQDSAGTWTTARHVNRKGHPVQWTAYDVPVSGSGAVNFDVQALVLNSQTVNGSVQYERNVDGPSGTVRFAYDANGNRTEKWTNGLFAARYFYDTDNQLKGISFNNDGDYTAPGDYEYVYDPFGRRVKAVEDGVTRYFVYDGLDCVAELDSSKNLAKYYTRGLGLGGGIGDIVAEWRLSMTNWYSYNHRGDVTLLTANAGRVTNRLEYTAFGSLSTINYQLSTRSIGFSSKEFDIKSGLTYYGFRYYECHSGTWLTKEPSGYDGPNLYWALYNAPETVIDILGRFGTGINGDVNHPGGGTYKGHTDFVGSDRFDYNKEDYGRNSPSLNPAAHFQELATSLQQVLGSISQCDKEVFESAMHRLQDYYSHVAKGYRWPPGHLPEEIGRQIMTLLGGSIGSGIAHNLGLSPDEDNEAWDKANQETGEYVNRWDENCCR